MTPERTDEERLAAIQAVVDKTRQVSGVRVGYPGGYWFKIAFAGGLNEAFATAFWEECQPYSLLIQGDALNDETARRILARTYARSVIREWGRDGDESPPPNLSDVDAVAAFLMGDVEMFEDIEALATDPENFRGERREYGDSGGVLATTDAPGEECRGERG